MDSGNRRADDGGAAGEVPCLHAIVDSLPQFVSYADRDLVYRFANQTYARKFGLAPEAIIGRPIPEVIGEQAFARVRPHIEQVLAGTPVHYRERLEYARGGALDIDATLIPDFAEDGEVRGWFGVVNDITPYTAVQEALRESSRRQEAAVEAGRVGLWDWDLGTGVVRYSKEWKRQLGYREEEIGSSFDEWRERVHPEDLAPALERMEAFIAGGAPVYDTVFRLRHKDGSYRWIWSQASAVTDAEGRKLRVLGSHVDVTERQAAEEERRRLQAELFQARKLESVGRLAGGVAHDFNNLLGVIVGFADLALLKTAAPDPVHADLVQVRQAAGRAADLTRKLLAFAKSQPAERRVIDLNATVEGMLDMLRRLVGEGVELAWSPGAGLWPVATDPSQVDQILVNLCANARDAVAGTGRVAVTTANADMPETGGSHPGSRDCVLLTVSDDGPGIPGEVMEHIFEPFFTTKEVGVGSGLGLATVHGIVEQNGGRIQVRTCPDGGASFEIYLPRSEGADRPAPAGGAPRPVAGGRETILVVEDEPALLDLTAQMLGALGYRVLRAGTPGEAAGIAQRDHVDLLITDVVMPRQSGAELARGLLACRPALRVLFMSGYAQDLLPADVTNQGFIAKPFGMDALAAKVRALLEGDSGAN